MEMQALIEEIAALVQKVKEGTASLGELEAFAAAAQQLNERAIILRYKAYEAKVYGASAHFGSAQHKPLTDRNTSDSAQGEQSTDLNTSDNTEPEETIDFAAEAAPVSEESEDLSFDLFSMDDISDSQDTEEEIVKEETPILEDTAEPVAEEPTFIEGETTTIEDIPVEPELVIETPIIEKSEPIVPSPSAVNSGNEHPIIRKALTNDGSLQSRLLSVRLETLKSAFGLNERMLIVRELFGGSTDAYADAIELLDNQSEIHAARSKVTDFANQYGWREDNELAVEFVQKVERRYA